MSHDGSGIGAQLDQRAVATSGIRERRDDDEQRGLRRVTEYLRALGLCDPPRAEHLASEIVASAREQDRWVSPSLCVSVAQARYARFLRSAFGERVAEVDPLWLRDFIAAHPALFLGDVQATRRAIQRFGDPWAGIGPRAASFREQRFERSRVPRWALGLAAPCLLTLAACAALLRSCFGAVRDPLVLGFVCLFVALFFLAAVGATVAAIGFALGARARAKSSLGGTQESLPRSAVVMPIHHEDAERVFAAVAAMREALARVPGGEAFELFVLSDSRMTEAAAAEERAYRRVVAAGDPRIAVYYRRRRRNHRHKAGNLAEFFERFGHRYTYAIVLDADSLMSAETMLELARRMEREPRLGLLQAPLVLHGGATLLARAQQFATSLVGPIFTRGLAAWADDSGNYYGHNAIVRVRAFLECCALPLLAGEPPLGGLILSHDFVEAALLRRAGWQVRAACDLEQSWEQMPATFPEYVARDRRWCQGNLQHLRIIGAEGLAPMSRIHLALGAAAYLAGPAWLSFVGLGVLLAYQGRGVFTAPLAARVFGITAVALLLVPRALGAVALLLSRERRVQHGGALNLVLSTILEALVAALLAPLSMVHHTRSVASIVAGRSVTWTQRRGASDSFGTIARNEATASLLGLAVALGLWRFAPSSLPWLAPVWLPLCAAIPLAWLVSSRGAGTALARFHLFRVPSETAPHELLLRAEDLRALTARDEAAELRDLVLDPLLLRAQLERLRERAPTPVDPAELSRVRARALRMGPAALSAIEREVLCNDAEGLVILHREAWRTWPVESWALARDQPQLPA